MNCELETDVEVAECVSPACAGCGHDSGMYYDLYNGEYLCQPCSEEFEQEVA